MNTYELIFEIIQISIAFLAIIIAWRANYKSNNLSERMLEIEEEREQDRVKTQNKANLRAWIEKTAKSSKLYIENTGEAQAENVEVFLDSVPISEHSCISRNQNMNTLIGAGSTVSYIISAALGRPFPSMIEIHWDDKSGEKGHYKSNLSL